MLPIEVQLVTDSAQTEPSALPAGLPAMDSRAPPQSGSENE